MPTHIITVEVKVDSEDQRSQDPDWFGDLLTGALGEYSYEGTYSLTAVDASPVAGLVELDEAQLEDSTKALWETYHSLEQTVQLHELALLSKLAKRHFPEARYLVLEDSDQDAGFVCQGAIDDDGHELEPVEALEGSWDDNSWYLFSNMRPSGEKIWANVVEDGQRRKLLDLHKIEPYLRVVSL